MSNFKLKDFKLSEYAAEVMVYFEKHKLIEIVTRLIAEIALERPEDVQKWIAHNLIRIADEIYSVCLGNSYKGGGEATFYQQPSRFLHRIVLFGRRGSGRKTQATALVRRFNLVYIDAEQVIYQYLKSANDNLACELQRAFETHDAQAKSISLSKLIDRRLKQTDCLHQGWVMINFPNSLSEFRMVLEQFKIPPNRVIYLQCSELMAMRRLMAQPSLGSPQDIVAYMECEMRYFKENEEEIKEYLSTRHEAIFIDSMACFQAVKTALWAELEKSTYVMGCEN